MTPESSVAVAFNALDFMTRGSSLILWCIVANTFMSRERFWYYIIANSLSHYMQAFTKIVIHEPRPTAVWTDIWPLGCDFHFGSPSGHSLENCNILLVLLLDHFWPSEWSRNRYPELNTKSI